MLIIGLIPIGGIIISTIFWGIIHLIKPNIEAPKKLITSIVVIIFILLPSITSMTISVFNCS